MYHGKDLKQVYQSYDAIREAERVAEWLRRLTRKPKVRTAVGSNPTLDSLVAVRNSSPGQPEPCEGNLVAVAGSCGGLMVKHPWPLLEISLSDFRRLATLNIYTYLPILMQSNIMSRTVILQKIRSCGDEYKNTLLQKLATCRWIFTNHKRFTFSVRLQACRKFYYLGF